MNQTSERIGSRLHRLSEVSMMKQVEPLSYALFPGYHCPLMGAMLTIGKIRDAVMLVIGPDECTYYTKMATSDGGRMASEGCQIVSVVLDQHDVTFGCKEAITEAFQELNEEYPGIYYQIFAYWGNNAPPKRMTVSEYVHVTFCTDLCCTAHPADGSLCTGKTAAGVNNKDYASWLRGWLSLTENVYVWHYYLPQHLLQYNVVDDVLLRDFRFFRECGVKGVFYNADTEGFGVEQIRYQLLAELNWRPDMTDEEYEALMCELLEKEYGEGWDCVRDYITMWTKAQDTRRTNACWHAIGGNKAMWDNRIDPYYYDTHSGEMISLVEEAIRLASSELQQKRAEMLSCHIYYTTVYTRYYRAEAAGDTALMNTLEGYYATAMDRLRRLGYNPCGDDVYAPFRAGYWITTWDSTTSGGYAKTAKEAAETDWTDAKGNLLRGLSGFIGMNEYGVKE